MYYACSLVEYIGRDRKLERSKVVNAIGKETLTRIYTYADVFHCEPIAKVADDVVGLCGIPMGGFDNVAACRYKIPGYWSIGRVFSRLIEDVRGECEDIVECMMRVYNSWIEEHVSNYNSDFYYQSREYIAECYREGEVL